MELGAAVRINSPGHTAHGLIGVLEHITVKGEHWVAVKEFGQICKLHANDLVAVQPKVL